jgi:hypothetical protein
MSWTKSYNSRDAFNERKAGGTPDDQMGERQKEQLEVTRRLAVQAMESDAFPDANDFSIWCSGHAAAEPSLGDSISISVAAK